MLLTYELRARLRRNAVLSEQGVHDHYPAVKFFQPDGSAKWLFTELAADQDTLYGLIDLGNGSPRLGHASLADISAMRGPEGLLVERERRFWPSRPLSAYAAEARRARRIVV